jgi:hypothetical protein
MLLYIIISVLSGILFAIFDSLINGNPYARKLMRQLEPLTKTKINIPLGISIDIFY